jgi:hypothetical protein
MDFTRYILLQHFIETTNSYVTIGIAQTNGLVQS